MNPLHTNKPGNFGLSRVRASMGGKAAAKVFKARFAHLVEGELVTKEQIAKRLGISQSSAAKRVAYWREQKGPLTWKRLQMKYSK